MGPYHTGEQSLVQTLWERLPDHSLTIADKGFINHSVLHHIQNKGTGRHWLLRAKSNLRWTIVRRLKPEPDPQRQAGRDPIGLAADYFNPGSPLPEQ